VNASQLRRLSAKTATLGLVLEDVGNPFSSILHRAVEDAARERDVLVFAGSCDEDAVRERELVATFRARRVDGLIVMPAGHDHSYLVSERRVGTAIVFVDRPARFLEADSVTVDNAGGAKRAVVHLRQAGHRRIAFLGDDPAITTADERFRGYREALVEIGEPFDPAIVRTGVRGSDAAELVTQELLTTDSAPTALFTGQNLLTIGAVRALRALRLHTRVALVGFDDIALAELLEPAITVVAQNPSEIGRLAAELLFRRLDGDSLPPRHIVLEAPLVQRGSGEIPMLDGKVTRR
jgi:LacI family transcriptional regulator